MEKYDIKVSREWIKKLIKKVCDKLGVTRESLGIFAGARATMHFDGNWKSVRYDAIDELAENGTDIIFIEKMPIVEVLTQYADKYGVAIVNTTGFLTEYGKDLLNAANRSGGHVAILTDYDDHGLLIVATLKKDNIDIPRIGIDEKTFQYFGLLRDNISIAAQQYLKDYDFLDHFKDGVVDKEFVKTRRVEIDAVLSQVGSERLWEYIMHKLIESSKTRDYNRVISMPAAETLYPQPIQDFLVYLNTLGTNITNNEEIKIQQDLENIEGMIEVDKKNAEIFNQLNKVVAEHDSMNVISSKVDDLLKALPKLN
jgi:hypothetical protein